MLVAPRIYRASLNEAIEMHDQSTNDTDPHLRRESLRRVDGRVTNSASSMGKHMRAVLSVVHRERNIAEVLRTG